MMKSPVARMEQSEATQRDTCLRMAAPRSIAACYSVSTNRSSSCFSADKAASDIRLGKYAELHFLAWGYDAGENAAQARL
jgi:hypothetical protein